MSRIPVIMCHFVGICLIFCWNIYRSGNVDIVPWVQWWCKAPSRSTCLTRQEEDQYWLESELFGRRLRCSDDRFGGSKNQEVPPSPLVTYYVPRLLPVYRSPTKLDIDTAPYRIPAKKFCKWHHMVFSRPPHPTLSQAQKLMKNFSNSDLREIYRISRLLTDDEVFRGAVHTQRYKTMWTRWLNTKGPDIAITFEETVP